jgi:hypothetical protein
MNQTLPISIRPEPASSSTSKRFTTQSEFIRHSDTRHPTNSKNDTKLNSPSENPFSGVHFHWSIARSIAWPCAIALIAWWFRSEIRALVPRLTRFRHNDTEFEFTQGVQRLLADAGRDHSLEPTTETPETTTDDTLARLQEIAAISPRAAIVEAWIDVERSSADAVRRLNIPIDQNLRTPMQFISMLSTRHIDPSRMRQIEELRRLRNEAAHFPEFTVDDATVTDYIRLARSMAVFLENLM